MSDIDDRHLAMLIAAHLFDRFLSSLPKGMRAYADETIRMREEFQANIQRMLVASNYSEANAYAELVIRHAREVAYRWANLRAAATKYAERDFRPMSCGYEKGDG